MSQMKKRHGYWSMIMLSVLLTICILGIPAQAQESPPEIFITPTTLPSGYQTPAMGPIVQRWRLVTVDFKPLIRSAQHISLNFFDDTAFSAVLDHVDGGPADQRTWFGHLAGYENSLVTLVFSADRLSGTLRFSEGYFQIRHLEGDIHLVRELESSKAYPAGSIINIDADETEVINLTNNERSANGIASLAYEDHLYNAARGHSEDMATRDFFDHTNPDGQTPADRIAAAGYSGTTTGENIAAGQTTPQAVVDAWMNSDGHRANILNANFKDIGVGHAYSGSSTYGDYWTQNFGAASSGGGTIIGDDGGGGCFVYTLK